MRRLEEDQEMLEDHVRVYCNTVRTAEAHTKVVFKDAEPEAHPVSLECGARVVHRQ